MINTQQLRYRYNASNDISFTDWSIGTGEHWLMLGRSGSGKTTLLHILAGLLKPTEGHVSIAETDIYQLPAGRLDHFRGSYIGLVFQRPHLIKSLTVSENIFIAQSFAGFKKNRDRVESVLTSLQLFNKRNSYPSELSQGQLQRVSIARAVVNQPALLMADEPTSSLDDENAFAVIDLLTEQATLNRSTLIIATHDQRVKQKIQNSYQL